MKLLKVDSTDQEVQGVDGHVLTIHVAVQDSKTLRNSYDKYVSISDRNNKAAQSQLHTSMHRMIDEALETLFDNKPRTNRGEEGV